MTETNRCLICREVKVCRYFLIAACETHVYDRAGDICQECYDQFLTDTALEARRERRTQHVAGEQGEPV